MVKAKKPLMPLAEWIEAMAALVHPPHMNRQFHDGTTYTITARGVWIRTSTKRHESKETTHNNGARRRQAATSDWLNREFSRIPQD